MNRGDPNLWQIPAWHPDWDGDFEFEALRTFAGAVMDATDLGATLAVIEEGYAHLHVFHGEMRIGLVYVNRADDPAVPLFTLYAGAKDEELTTEDVAADVRFLDARRTPFPEDAG